MIAGFRKSLRSWATLLLLFLALVAIVVTGFGTDGMGGLGSLSGGGSNAGDTLATVEGKAIPASEVSDLVNRQYVAARQQRPTVTMAELLAEGLFEQTLNQLITQSAIEHFAGERGLVVSDRLVDKMIVNIPEFRNFTGQFDAATFRQVLESQNLTEGRFRADVARQLLQRQLLAPIAVGARVPQGISREYANLLLERRRGTIGFVPTEALTAGIDPSDAEIAAFYRANRQGFTLPERRVIRYALIGPEQVAQAGAATDAEIAQVYRANQARFGARETRTLQQVVLPSQSAAQAFVQRVRSGTSFADAASQAGFSAGDITFENQSREQFARATTPQVAAAGFAAAQGSVAGPVRSELGFHVIRVERVSTTPARSLESARAEIAAFIERRKRVDALNDLLDPDRGPARRRLQLRADRARREAEHCRHAADHRRRTHRGRPDLCGARRAHAECSAPPSASMPRSSSRWSRRSRPTAATPCSASSGSTPPRRRRSPRSATGSAPG